MGGQTGSVSAGHGAAARTPSTRWERGGKHVCAAGGEGTGAATGRQENNSHPPLMLILGLRHARPHNAPPGPFPRAAMASLEAELEDRGIKLAQSHLLSKCQ